jgi:transcriptional regulator with XRE-family HTH domain
MRTDPLWNSNQARGLAARRDAGALVRLGRTYRGWSQGELGRRIDCSASTVSRLEARTSPDLATLRRAAHAVGMPTRVLAAAIGLDASPATTVAALGPDSAEEDPLRRRTLLAAVGLAAPSPLLAGVDDVLAATPAPTSSGAPPDGRLAKARLLFDAGQHGALARTLPGLIGDAHAAARATRTDLDYARLSACYGLFTKLLTKTGHYDRSRITADRATTFAELSGSALAMAAAARETSIVLRHQDRSEDASRLIHDALTRIEATGLKSAPQASAYAQLLCTTSYTAARAGDRTQALAMIEEATRAARRLPDTVPEGRLFAITPAAVTLYAVGIHWALGDAGTALETGRHLRDDQFPTAERRARKHTDFARAWWLLGKPEQTAQCLLSAHRRSAAEVRERPAIRKIVTGLAEQHRQVPGVRELAAATAL